MSSEATWVVVADLLPAPIAQRTRHRETRSIPLDRVERRVVAWSEYVIRYCAAPGRSRSASSTTPIRACASPEARSRPRRSRPAPHGSAATIPAGATADPHTGCEARSSKNVRELNGGHRSLGRLYTRLIAALFPRRASGHASCKQPRGSPCAPRCRRRRHAAPLPQWPAARPPQCARASSAAPSAPPPRS
ncbi:MAG: hypothetical protein K0S86_574 [Geminicoccaceae bacterium]|nr:hypothetical protein [Geminicoccaceae bacterium]